MSIELSSQDGVKMAEFFSDFSKAQAEINNVLAGKDGHNYKYAELYQVLAVIRKPFSDHGLAIMQLPSSTYLEDGTTKTQLSTMIIHKSGEWIKSTMNIDYASNAKMSQIQQLGSHITYARRYMASAIVGVSQVDNEDDITPDATLSLQNKGIDIEALKEDGIKEAEKGREALAEWYKSQSATVKKYLKGDGADVMDQITKSIKA